MLEIKTDLVQKICVIYLLLWSVCPPLSLDMIYRVLALICVAVWMFYAVKKGYKFDRNIFLFMLLVVVVACIETYSIEGILQKIAFYMLGIACFMYDYYQDHMEELKGIPPVILGLLFVWNMRTYTELLLDPTIARAIVRNDEAIYEFIRKGVGGYALIYMQVCILPMVVTWILQAFRRHKVLFVIGVAWLVSFIMVIGNAGYTIAITTCVVSIAVMLFYRGKSVVPAVLVAVALVIGLLALIIYSEGFREFLLVEFDGTKITHKINDLVTSVQNEEAVDSIAIRIRRYSESLGTIFTYPVIGGLCWSGGGGHSAILDAFAKYGLFGGIVFAKCVFLPLRIIKQTATDMYAIRVANATIVSFLMVGLLDSFSYEFMFMLVLFVPMLYYDISKWRTE